MEPDLSASIARKISRMPEISSAGSAAAMSLAASFLRRLPAENFLMRLHTSLGICSSDATPFSRIQLSCRICAAVARCLGSRVSMRRTQSFAGCEMRGHGCWLKSSDCDMTLRKMAFSLEPPNGGKPHRRM
eukprot:240327-Chlamydomonas_euryale.AAC.1